MAALFNKKEGFSMSRRCELTDKGVMAGNKISHSHRKTRCRFLPNLQKVSLKSDVLKRVIRLSLATNTIRSIDHNGGLDAFLLTAKTRNLAPRGIKLKREIKKALAAAKTAA